MKIRFRPCRRLRQVARALLATRVGLADARAHLNRLIEKHGLSRHTDAVKINLRVMLIDQILTGPGSIPCPPEDCEILPHGPTAQHTLAVIAEQTLSSGRLEQAYA